MVGQVSSLPIGNDGHSCETRGRRHQIICFFGNYFLKSAIFPNGSYGESTIKVTGPSLTS